MTKLSLRGVTCSFIIPLRGRLLVIFSHESGLNTYTFAPFDCKYKYFHRKIVLLDRIFVIPHSIMYFFLWLSLIYVYVLLSISEQSRLRLQEIVEN